MGTPAKWSLLLEQSHGAPELSVVTTVEGTREEAEAQCGEVVRAYQPVHPRRPQRRRVFRTQDGWLLMGDGASGYAYTYRFTMCELVWDSGPL
ncbi:hypothetical protein ACIHCQ_13510 [Streptomyces sp. NPDC052236]|uniref:hypothetical protein n=1 Tax=Streptomyces sp. NPDC052236 TaxID=3365686 RepID=UPI0037CF70B6